MHVFRSPKVPPNISGLRPLLLNSSYRAKAGQLRGYQSATQAALSLDCILYYVDIFRSPDVSDILSSLLMLLLDSKYRVAVGQFQVK